MENGVILKECLSYFTTTPVLKKILDCCLEKYRSFGNVCGTVVLRGLKPQDIESLEGFTGKNYHGRKSISLSTVTIQKSIDGSCFAGISLDELLESYYEGTLKSKKQEAFEEKNAIVGFYQRLGEAFTGTRAGEWIQTIPAGDSYLYKMLCKKYRDKVLNISEKREEAQEQLWKEMNQWMISLNHLPVFLDRYEYLSAFSAEVFGNPHYYDEGMEYTLLLYYAINDILHLNQVVSSAMPAEDRHHLLLMAGLIKDDVSNDAMVYGIRAWGEKGEHSGIAGFYTQKEPVSITLSTIIGLKDVKCMKNCIYVVENPVVFAKIMEPGDKSVLCVNGQPNLAVLLILDLIVKNGGTIFYNGDFDPEGLLIAERLKKRYPEDFLFWHYEEADFHKALSDNHISDKRLKMLDSLSSPELVRIGEQLRKYKKAGYQERIFFDQKITTVN